MKTTTPAHFSILLAVITCIVPVKYLHADTIWEGGVDANWSNPGNWSNGLPTTASTPSIGLFGVSETYSISLSEPTDVRWMIIQENAGDYVFGADNTQSLVFTGGTGFITQQYGVNTAQTFNANIAMHGTTTTSGDLTLRNDSAAPAGKLIVNGNIGMAATSSNTTLRSVNLSGLGGGTISGNIVDGGSVSALGTVSGGGKWVLTGANTYTGTAGGAVTVRGGSTLVLDYSANNSAKINSAQQLKLNGSRAEIYGNNDANTAVSFAGLTYNGTSNTPGDSFGSASSLHAVAGTGQQLTVNLGAITGSVSNPRVTSMRLSSVGDVTFTASVINANVEAYLVLNRDFGTRNATTGVLEARNDYLAPTGSGSNSFYYATSGTATLAGTGTFNFLGFKLTSTANGQSFVTDRAFIGASVLFAGDHDYTIRTGGFGAAGSGGAHHIFNVGNGSLTLDGALRGNIYKEGFGDVILAKAATNDSATSTQLLSVVAAEGRLIVKTADAFGPTGSSANTASTQSGATIALMNGITLPNQTTFQLHGLGYQEGGALRNLSGNNTLNGNILLGITSQISSDADTLTLGGNIDAYSSTTGANTALIFDGAGNTVVNGRIGSVQNFAYGLTKKGTGTLTLNGANAYTTATLVSKGKLVVGSSGTLASSKVTVQNGATFTYNNNTTAYAGNIVLETGAFLTGSGRLASTLSGSGQVGPGNSPGILTANAVDFTEGLDFAFEFTAAGNPVWSNNVASGNDVLRVTAATSFVGTATSDNVFTIYFTADNTTYRGGLFTDANANFSASVASATFNYYIWNGSDYTALDASAVTRSVVSVASADFADGTVLNGWTMEFIVSTSTIPEPASWTFAGLLGAAGMVLRLRRSYYRRSQA